jgi:TatD DNase family protein
VRISPPDKILFETDSPFLTPVPFRGQENAPFHLPYVAKKNAELKLMDQKILEDIVFENSLRCFSKLKN